ncbi:MAG: EAL domain-containing protein [Atopobiaceae bacterium]|nr:EAL domain-containing protein [Atopobiaceae bacterium]
MDKTKRSNIVSRVALSILAVLSITLILVGVSRLYGLYKNLAENDESMARASLRDQKQHSVLFLSSYSQSHFSVPMQWDGINQAFEGTEVLLDTEYMDMKNNADDESQVLFEQLLRHKLESHAYDVLIVGDDAALNFAEEHRNDLFKGMPVVFLGINDIDHAHRVHDEGWATGIPEQSNMADVFKTAANIFNACGTFVCIVDDTETGKADVVSLEQVMPQLPNHKFEIVNLSQLSEEEFLKRMGELKDNTIVFELDAFKDRNGKVYTIDDVCRLLANNCPRPVFRVSTGGVGNGALCSGFLDFTKFGNEAGQMAIEILNGKAPSNIDLAGGSATEYVFDYQQLKRFNINNSQLPENSIVLGNDSNLMENYGAILKPMGYVLIGFACLTLFLVLEFLKSRRSERDLYYRHYHDSLTDLPNRNAAKQLHGRRTVGSVALIDIDGFRFINEVYGYSRGDVVIKTLADRLRNLPELRCVRYGADEFLVLFDGDIAKERKLFDEVVRLTHEPVEADDQSIEISCSAGIVVRDGDQTLEELMTDADLALYEARESSGRSRYAYYSPQMREKIDGRRQVISSLDQAIAEESFRVVYQPQIDLASGKLYGFEALCRFKDDLYYPNEFIPVAESVGLIIQIDRIVTKKAVEQMRIWRDAGFEVPSISINYSPTQLKDTEYCAWLKGLLDEAQIPANLVKLEVTESGSFEGKWAQQFFSEVHETGMQLALDDYGTGYSTLNAVSAYPMDFIKLDKSVNDSHLQPGSEYYLESLVTFIHDLGKRVVAEGVEDAVQIELAKKLQIDYIQGYYYSPPLEANAAETWLNKRA